MLWKNTLETFFFFCLRWAIPPQSAWLFSVKRGPRCTLFQSANTLDLFDCSFFSLFKTPLWIAEHSPWVRPTKSVRPHSLCTRQKLHHLLFTQVRRDLEKEKKIKSKICLEFFFYGYHVVDGIPVTSIFFPPPLGRGLWAPMHFVQKKKKQNNEQL